MGNFKEAGKTTDFQDGTKRKVTIDGHEIMIAQAGEKYYAVSNKCTHMGGDISAGVLEGNIITCPRHGSQFDITSGNAVRWLKGKGIIASLGKVIKPPKPLQVYSIKVENDTIFVEI